MFIALLQVIVIGWIEMHVRKQNETGPSGQTKLIRKC